MLELTLDFIEELAFLLALARLEIIDGFSGFTLSMREYNH
jgi:hypothetical protein